MEVVAAGVHHGLVDIITVIDHSLFGGVGFGGFFEDGEGVDVGTEEDGGTRVVTEDGDLAVAADVCGKLKVG